MKYPLYFYEVGAEKHFAYCTSEHLPEMESNISLNDNVLVGVKPIDAGEFVVTKVVICYGGHSEEGCYAADIVVRRS